MIGGSIAVRIKDKYRKSKSRRVDRKRMKKDKKVNWKNLTKWE